MIMKHKNESCSVASNTLRPGTLQARTLWSGWPFPSPGIFQTQGLNPGLLHYRWILYQLSYQGSPRILECVAYSFSRGSSQPRNQTGLSCIAGRFLYQLSYQGSPNNDIYIVYKFQCKICSIISREWREPVSVI